MQSTFAASTAPTPLWHSLCHLRGMHVPKTLNLFWSRIKETFKQFSAVDPVTEASSLAYFTIFAIPGVLMLTLSVASTFYDTEAVHDALYTQAGSFIGESTSEDLQGMVKKASESKKGLLAKVVGIVALVISTTTAFASLQGSLNKIWQVERRPGHAVLRYLLSRAISFGLIAAFGFLLLVSMVLDAALAVVADNLGGTAADRIWLWSALAFALSYGVITLVFGLVFKFLPDARVKWRSVWMGAAFTAAVFTLGKFLIGLYIAKSGAADAYGAGGAVIILLIWVFVSSLILLFGAQFTYVVARENGNPIVPGKYAQVVGGEGEE
jgi:membrane protein